MACPQPAYWDYLAGGIYTVTSRDVKDPLQGNYLPNCSLIAVLASLAWKKTIPALQNHTITKELTEPYTFTFYTAANTPVTQKTSGKLPLDANRKLLHAKSDTSATEIWPALWEKAYYQWLSKKDPPDYCLYQQWQNPETVLLHLTGKNPLKTKSNGISCLVAGTTFSQIYSLCESYARSTINYIIKMPAVAWTFDPAVTNPAKVQFSPTTIAARHTYSLLGVVKTGTEVTQQYIVLRNPYGTTKRDPASGSVSLYNPGGLWCSQNIYLSDTSDGIFAIRADDFVKYFEGYAWMPL